MILLAAAFFVFSSPVLAQSPLPAAANFSLNQENQTLRLETQEFETLYRTDMVPSTCYRSEVQGSTTQCHTEYDHQCHTEYQQQCGYRNYPVCQTVPRNVCYPQEECQTIMDNVCNSHGCTPVPRRVCHTENRCTTQYDNVCHNEPRYECQTVPQTLCQDVPRQACIQVPNVVQVPYSCMKPVQVPIGQRMKLDTIADVSVKFANFSEAGALSETLSAKLVDGKVILNASGATKSYLYQVDSENQSNQMISATEKAVTAQFSLRATSIQKLNQFASLSLSQGKIASDQIEFTLSANPEVPFKGHLKLLQNRTFGGHLVIVDNDFKSNAIVTEGGVSHLMLNNFGVNGLRSKHHEATLSLSLDMDALKNELLNPDALPLLNSNDIETQFEGNP